MSSLLMRSYCERLRKHIGLPPGFKMEVDGATDNILVSNDKLGFCITRHACKDFPMSRIVRESKENIERIQKATPDEVQAAANAGRALLGRDASKSV